MAVRADDSDASVATTPLPPPAPGAQTGVPGREPATAPVRATTVRRGDIVASWRVALAVAWMLVFFGYAAIWQASVQIGIGTWWIGPRAQPTNVLIKMLPFALALTMAMCIVYEIPRVLRVSGVGVCLAALLSIPDFSRSRGLGVAEALVALLVGLVTLAATSGRYRVARPERTAAALPPAQPLPPPPS